MKAGPFQTSLLLGCAFLMIASFQDTQAKKKNSPPKATGDADSAKSTKTGEDEGEDQTPPEESKVKTTPKIELTSPATEEATSAAKRSSQYAPTASSQAKSSLKTDLSPGTRDHSSTGMLNTTNSPKSEPAKDTGVLRESALCLQVLPVLLVLAKAWPRLE